MENMRARKEGDDEKLRRVNKNAMKVNVLA
jgi:hypothetical protein